MPELSQEPEQTFKSRVFLPPDPRGVKDGQGPRLRLCWGPAPRSPGPGRCLAVLASVTRGFLRRHWGLRGMLLQPEQLCFYQRFHCLQSSKGWKRSCSFHICFFLASKSVWQKSKGADVRNTEKGVRKAAVHWGGDSITPRGGECVWGCVRCVHVCTRVHVCACTYVVCEVVCVWCGRAVCVCMCVLCVHHIHSHEVWAGMSATGHPGSPLGGNHSQQAWPCSCSRILRHTNNKSSKQPICLQSFWLALKLHLGGPRALGLAV